MNTLNFTETELAALEKNSIVLRELADWHDYQATMGEPMGYDCSGNNERRIELLKRAVAIEEQMERDDPIQTLLQQRIQRLRDLGATDVQLYVNQLFVFGRFTMFEYHGCIDERMITAKTSWEAFEARAVEIITSIRGNEIWDRIHAGA